MMTIKAAIKSGRPCLIIPERDEFGNIENVEHMMTMVDAARLRMELGIVLNQIEIARKNVIPHAEDCPYRPGEGYGWCNCGALSGVMPRHLAEKEEE